MLETPVLFLVYNRPTLTERVFERIRQIEPQQLFVAADGPRPNRSGEAELCAATRAIVNRIDWTCNVQFLYRDYNFGCKRAVSSAITWFFEQVEEGIVLEDDCLPDPTFFRFCAELLAKYRENEKVMMVGGSNHHSLESKSRYSYHFSCFPQIWGWGSWRRAWNRYDVDMKLWPQLSNSGWLPDYRINKKLLRQWDRKFDAVYQGRTDTWDYQWLFAFWVHSGLSITPNRNLVANIGFGETATHTTQEGHPLGSVAAETMRFPLRHPPRIVQDIAADRRTLENILRLEGVQPSPSLLQASLHSLHGTAGKCARWILRKRR